MPTLQCDVLAAVGCVGVACPRCHRRCQTVCLGRPPRRLGSVSMYADLVAPTLSVVAVTAAAASAAARLARSPSTVVAVWLSSSAYEMTTSGSVMYVPSALTHCCSAGRVGGVASAKPMPGVDHPALYCSATSLAYSRYSIGHMEPPSTSPLVTLMSFVAALPNFKYTLDVASVARTAHHSRPLTPLRSSCASRMSCSTEGYAASASM